MDYLDRIPDSSLEDEKQIPAILLKIKPMKVGDYCEQCLVEIASLAVGAKYSFYPSALVHIDAFWQGRNGDNTVYNMLNKGEQVLLKVDLLPHSDKRIKP